MRRWLSVPLFFVVAYGALLGFFSWKMFATHIRPDYRPILRWSVPWISPPQTALHQAYFRKKIYVGTQPLSAWVAVIAPDKFTLFVNGTRIESPTYDSGYSQGVFDIAEHLKPGTNVLAIRNDVFTYHQRTRIAVQGRYIEWTGAEGLIQSDASWRTAWRNESLTSLGGIVRPTPWFRPDFDDAQWSYVTEGEVPAETVTKRFPFSPVLFTEPVRGPWIWADRPDALEAFFRLSVDLEETPRDAWLRVMVKRHHRLLVNGNFVATHEQTIGTDAAPRGPLRAYNINPFLRRGHNVVAVQASNTWSDRGLLIDGWVEKQDGSRQLLYAGDWKATVTPQPGWDAAAFDDAGWSPAAIMKPVTPADQSSLVVEQGLVKRPLSFQFRLFALALLHLTAALALSLLLWAGTARVLAALTEEPAHAVARWLAACFVPPAVLLGVLYLLGFDARLSLGFPYQPHLIGLSLLLLLALLVTLLAAAALARRGVRRRLSLPEGAWRPWAARVRGVKPVAIVLIGLLVAGFYLRYKDLDYEPLGGDETSAALYTSGVLERGYPSVLIDGHPKIALTSEFTLYLKAPLVWLFGPGPYSYRLTDVVFGSLTILLLYRAGRLLHGKRAGLFAAAVYTFLPSVIGMTHYSRYPSQQQFFALLTAALLYKALEGERVRVRELYLGAAAFVGAYLSWEGAIFYLPSIALGLMMLTRPNFTWLKNRHVWLTVGLMAWLVFCQLAYRQIAQAERLVYGSGARDASIKLLWLYPFYDPYFYIRNFFLIENHHVLSLIFALGFPLWFSRSRHGRALGYMATTLGVHLALVTNLLELSQWRYVYLLFPLLVLSASMTLVIFLDYLGGLARSVRVPGGVARWIGHATAAGVVGCALVFSTAFVVKLYNLPWSYTSIKTRLWTRTYPSMEAARDYIRSYRLPGDVVIAVNPHVWRFLGEPVDYFVQSQLRLSLNLGRDPGTPIHRMSGVPTILSAEEFKEVVARSSRVWLVSYGPSPPAVEKSLANLIQDTMRPVYEDFSATVYLLGDRTPHIGQNPPERVRLAVKER